MAGSGSIVLNDCSVIYRRAACPGIRDGCLTLQGNAFRNSQRDSPNKCPRRNGDRIAIVCLCIVDALDIRHRAVRVPSRGAYGKTAENQDYKDWGGFTHDQSR